MERLIFDTHAHYDASAFDQDRHQLLAQLPQKGVALAVSCGTDLQSSRLNIALAQEYDWMYAAVGIHPTCLIEEESSTCRQFQGDWTREMDEMANLYQQDKVVAVGEVGLDHHWPVPQDTQLEMFKAHILLSKELELPMIIHDREAHGEMYQLLKKYKPKGVLHSFSGSAEDVKWLCAQGMYIGFAGVVTFKNARRPLEAVQAVPPELLVLETDCPYLAPVPFRGKRSDSSMIAYTAEKIAEVRQVDTRDLLQQTLANGKRLFSIS